MENNLKSLFSLYASLSILSVEEKSEHLLEFYNLDKNRDGSIDFAELVEGLQNTFAMDYDRAVASVSKIFAQAGKGHHHCLQFHEYVAATTSVTREVYERSLVKMFDELDCNKDGQISPEELGKSI